MSFIFLRAISMPVEHSGCILHPTYDLSEHVHKKYDLNSTNKKFIASTCCNLAITKDADAFQLTKNGCVLIW